MAEEVRQGRSIKIKPSVLREAHHIAIESQKTVGKWVEEAIEEKIAREQKKVKQKGRPGSTGLSRG